MDRRDAHEPQLSLTVRFWRAVAGEYGEDLAAAFCAVAAFCSILVLLYVIYT